MNTTGILSKKENVKTENVKTENMSKNRNVSNVNNKVHSEDFFDILASVNGNHENVKLQRENYHLRIENGRLNYKLQRIEKAKQKRKKTIKKAFEYSLYAIGISLFAWFIVSYINVIANNLTTPENIWDWNFFKVMVHIGEFLHK